MIKKVDHIGIAVKDLASALAFYSQGIGLKVTHQEVLPEEETKVTMVPVGDIRLEFLEATSETGPVGKFLANRGEGVHHVCFEVDDLRATLKELERAGFQLINTTPRPGAHGTLVAFVHPKSASGVLIELNQPAQRDEPRPSI